MWAVGWQIMGVAQDLVPGDAVAVHEGGQGYLKVAQAMRRSAAVLRGLDSGTSSGAASVTALLDNRDEIAQDVMAAQQRYQAAGKALVEYAIVLDGVQQMFILHECGLWWLIGRQVMMNP